MCVVETLAWYSSVRLICITIVWCLQLTFGINATTKANQQQCENIPNDLT